MGGYGCSPITGEYVNDPWRDTAPKLDKEVQDFADRFMRGEITVKRNLGDPRKVMYSGIKGSSRKGDGIHRGKTLHRRWG